MKNLYLSKLIALGLMTFSLGVTSVQAQTPASLDDLLEQTRNVRAAEAKVNAEREAKFLAERDNQVSLMNQARADLNEQQQRSAQLTSTFDANEKTLTDLQEQLDARAGNLGEMFGVVRQVANDFSSVVTNSMISAQFPGRAAFTTGLAQSKALPSINDLERFWFELQREMTETGKVVKYKTKIITAEGNTEDGEVVRIGPFTALSNGKYMAYLPTQEQLAVMARQPGSKYETPAREFSESESGYAKGIIDPTRGTLLSIYAQRPTLWERVETGEAVGYVIIVVGILGFVLGLYQLFYLTLVRNKVRDQLNFLTDPQPTNPLGRVLATFKGADTEKLEMSAEVVELRISEAVLKEIPALERYQSLLKLCVAAGPLLGLVGTVVGMIITFQVITESGSSDPKLMAAGISAAMIATVLGLGIAIPLLFMNAWLVSLSKSVTQVLDEQSAGLLAERLEALEAEGKKYA
jgi:biopolymer transport protein ExbB